MATAEARASPRLLIAEDDYAIASNLFTYFERQGFEVDAVYSGQAALHRCSVERYDLVMLDLGLPGLDGLAVLERLRTELRATTPVLVITARSELGDKLAGFARGADDYMTKPFALAEVEARVRALLARTSARPSPETALRFGPLRFDAARHDVRVDETPVRLPPKAVQLLELLLRRPGELVRRAEVEQALWGSDPPQPDAVRSQVHALRKALADAGYDGLETVHGVGYRLAERPGAAP
jgi:DNA-binding response OmpR family regulator